MCPGSQSVGELVRSTFLLRQHDAGGVGGCGVVVVNCAALMWWGIVAVVAVVGVAKSWKKEHANKCSTRDDGRCGRVLHAVENQ